MSNRFGKTRDPAGVTHIMRDRYRSSTGFRWQPLCHREFIDFAPGTAPAKPDAPVDCMGCLAWIPE